MAFNIDELDVDDILNDETLLSPTHSIPIHVYNPLETMNSNSSEHYSQSSQTSKTQTISNKQEVGKVAKPLNNPTNPNNNTNHNQTDPPTTTLTTKHKVGPATSENHYLLPNPINSLPFLECGVFRVSKAFLGNNNGNGFLKATSNTQRIKKQRLRQIESKINKGEGGGGGTSDNVKGSGGVDNFDGDDFGLSSLQYLGSGNTGKEKGNSLNDLPMTTNLAKAILNPHTQKRLRSELSGGIDFCVALEKAIIDCNSYIQRRKSSVGSGGPGGFNQPGGIQSNQGVNIPQKQTQQQVPQMQIQQKQLLQQRMLQQQQEQHIQQQQIQQQQVQEQKQKQAQKQAEQKRQQQLPHNAP